MNMAKNMRDNRTAVQWVCAVLFLATVAGGFSAMATADGDRAITILHRQSEVINTPWKVVTVAITDPAIANVQVLTPEQILIQGLTIGTTDIILFNEDKTEILQKQVKVSLDVDTMQEALNQLFPASQLQVMQSGQSLVVKGHHKSASSAVQMTEFLDETEMTYMDMTDVSGVQQVQLQVRIAEVTKVALESLGVEWVQAGTDFQSGIRPGGPIADTYVGGSGMLTGIEIGSTATAFGIVTSADLAFFLEALAENQYLRLLANPTLIALSGEEAGFLAGGEFPVPVVQSSGTGAGGSSISIEYKEYGVRLKFKPIVLGDGTIRLYAAPEVSELDYANGTTVNGTAVPGVLARKAETTLELHSGQSFAMAGLLSNSITSTNSSIPGLGNLPVLGPLFRSVRYQNKETELVILVTANLVEPLNIDPKTAPLPGVLHETPDDWQIYIDGKMDGGDGMAKLNEIDAEWLKRLGLDELNGPGAWDSYAESAPMSEAPLVNEE
ncbi:MAG: type II and III secretion system protein family protein [Planctomycetota bacterium]|jgi:pilus assembly protein CpaC